MTQTYKRVPPVYILCVHPMYINMYLIYERVLPYQYTYSVVVEPTAKCMPCTCYVWSGYIARHIDEWRTHIATICVGSAGRFIVLIQWLIVVAHVRSGTINTITYTYLIVQYTTVNTVQSLFIVYVYAVVGSRLWTIYWWSTYVLGRYSRLIIPRERW